MPTPPDPDPTPRRVLPAGEPVLVTMPGSTWQGFVGTVDYYMSTDTIVVRIQTSTVTDRPPTAMVPHHWVKSLAEILHIPDSGGGGVARRASAGTDGSSSDPVGDGPST